MPRAKSKANAEADREKKFDAFISHSSKDVAYADAIVRKLELAGIKCWIAPRDIIPGSNYGESIVEGIETSRTMVLVFSEHANDSPQINREVERAVHNRIKIVPFRVKDVPPAKNLEYFISSPHWLDAFSGSLDENIDYLASTINHLLARTDSVPVAPIRRRMLPPNLWPKIVARLGNRRALATLGFGSAALFAVLYYFFAPLPVERAFLGKWESSFGNSGLTQLQNVKRSGTLETETIITEKGTIQIQNGFINLRAAAGYDRPITWEIVDDSTVKASLIPNSFWQIAMVGQGDAMQKMSAMAMNQVWKKTTTEKRPGIAIWELNSDQEPTWRIRFQTGPGPNYTFRAELPDAGSFRAQDGKWTFISNASQQVVSGTYQVIDDDRITVSSAIAQSVWKRLP